MKNSHNHYEYIQSTLEAIDVLIKGSFEYISSNEVSRLLNITPDEVNYIAKQKNIDNISSNNILTIMLNGSSKICKLFRKSLNYTNTYQYSAADIAYIYSVDKNIVITACNNLNISDITDEQLPQILNYISCTE